jgi:glycine/D-amino acid oxidase-like deaminating enzyme
LEELVIFEQAESHAHHITALREVGGAIDHVEVTNAEGRFERVRGDAFVLAMGPFSPLLAQPLGIRLPIYPGKGYSVTMPVKDARMAHQVSLTDDECKLVFSRYTSQQGDRLRIAGTAKLNGYHRDLNQVRCDAIVRRVKQLFPGAGDASQAQFWTGLRPATPSNVPLIGKARVGNLFLNTGHGTLGWTHACGSGKSIAHRERPGARAGLRVHRHAAPHAIGSAARRQRAQGLKNRRARAGADARPALGPRRPAACVQVNTVSTPV